MEAEGLSFTEFNDCLVAVALEKVPAACPARRPCTAP